MKIAALYSKKPANRQSFLDDFLNDHDGPIIYIYPKNMGSRRVAIPGAFTTTYEDMYERNQWLRINSLIGSGTALVMENLSRYPKAITNKSRALRRLSMQVQTKALIDIVPFTQDIQYLYTPLSFLTRGILGYSRNQAFRENYQEMGEDGVIRSAHDYDVLAEKMKTACSIDYDGFMLRNRAVVDCPTTPDEQDVYAKRREELFTKETSHQRIITRLADTVHAFDSRLERMKDVLSECYGRTLVLCNLGTYAKRAQSAAREIILRDIVATSYQTAMKLDIETFDNVVYLESPIVNGYYMLDVEAALPEHCNVYHCLSDTRVDKYLYGEIDRELLQIHRLTKELYRVARF